MPDMSLNEFRAWLEGFEAAITGDAPTAEQWAAIKAKLASVRSVAAPLKPTEYLPYTSPRWNETVIPPYTTL